MKYKIIRFFSDENKDNKIIQRGLTLEEAQKHCSREDTHKIKPNGEVVWFDGYDEEYPTN
jgi:hypothetical protein